MSYSNYLLTLVAWAALNIDPVQEYCPCWAWLVRSYSHMDSPSTSSIQKQKTKQKKWIKIKMKKNEEVHIHAMWIDVKLSSPRGKKI